jgi:signal transduction histidine kinase
MVWPAWRLYDLFMAVLVYFTWKYAWSARDLKVVYSELGRSTRLAAELEQSKEESRRQATFLNAISHDLRTPLNGMMLQANLAELSLAGNDTQSLKTAVTEIKSSAKATAELLDSLLECARAEWSGQHNVPSVFSLNEVIGKLVSASQAVADSAGLYFRHSCPQNLRVRCDRLKLERILANLASNSLKFTRSGGIRVDVQRAGTGIEIHVVDTGVGIPLEHRERIFDEFFQGHNDHRDRSKGFGLGLSIA